MREFRKDFKFALVEEYRNYWNAYQNPNEFYSDLIGLEVLFNNHFLKRKAQAKGQQAVTELKLVDQNTLWFIMYGNTKRALDCLEGYNKDQLEYKCKSNRIIHTRNIVKINK
jgi:capsid portal protein